MLPMAWALVESSMLIGNAARKSLNSATSMAEMRFFRSAWHNTLDTSNGQIVGTRARLLPSNSNISLANTDVSPGSVQAKVIEQSKTKRSIFFVIISDLFYARFEFL